jgi:hypothetical protein
VRPARLGVIGCLLFAAAACSAVPSAADSVPSRNSVSSNLPTVVAAEQRIRSFGERVGWGGGLIITVSQPRSVHPSTAAFPPAGRAAVFDVTIENYAATPYRPSQLAVSATVNGKLARQVVDPGSGLGGITDAGQELPQGKRVHLTAAFEVAVEPTDLQVTVQPDAATPGMSATFAGQA